MALRIQGYQSHFNEAFSFLNLALQIDKKVYEIAKRMLVIVGLSFALFMGALVGLALPAYSATFALCFLCSALLLAVIAIVEEIRYRILLRESKMLNLASSTTLNLIEEGVKLERRVCDFLETVSPFTRQLRSLVLWVDALPKDFKDSAKLFYASARELLEIAEK